MNAGTRAPRRLAVLALAALVAPIVLLALAGGASAATLRIDAPADAPATAFLSLEVAGPAEIALGFPPGSTVTALAVDGAPVAWRFAAPGRLLVPVPANATELRLHATLPGDGPWTFSGVDAAAFDAPGLVVTPTADGAVVSRPAPAGPSPWPAVAAAALVAVVAAVLLARRDAGRGPGPQDARLLDHLRELQARLRVALAALLLLVLFFAAFGLRAVDVAGGSVALPLPGEPTLATSVYRAMAERFVPDGVALVVIRPMDAVLAMIWVAVLLGMVAGLPVLAYEAAAFLGPALLPHERRAVRFAVPLIVASFLAGVVFAYFLLVPVILATLYGFAPGLGAVAFLAVPELVGFAAVLCLVMGLAFQLPILLGALARAGVVTPRALASKWRHALVGIFVAAAVVTPDPTIVSQLFVAVPMTALYAAGVAAAYALAPKKA